MEDMATFLRPIAATDNVWIEENGPYLTTGDHNHILRAMGESVARRLTGTLVAPIVTIEPGNPERASTPGGIRFSQETYMAVPRDMATSLKAQGFTWIFLLGDSGGNRRGGEGRA